MAVASGKAALRALSVLVHSNPVPVSTLLRRPYLPDGMTSSADPVQLGPDDLIGGYGHEDRYLLTDGDAELAAVVAGAPADLSAGQPAPSRVDAYVKSSLDLTMQGGTTSGVVYPLAVCDLATRFRFRNVGGASAGAIAAAITAAAELGRSERVRQRTSPPAAVASETPPDGLVRQGFVGVTDVITWLTQTGLEDPQRDEFRLAQLFRPAARSHRVYRVLVAVMRERFWALPLIALAAFGWLTRVAATGLILATIALTGVVADRFAGTDRPWSATLGHGVVGFAAALVTGIAVALIGTGLRSLLAALHGGRDRGPEWLRRLARVTSSPSRPPARAAGQLGPGLVLLLLAGAVLVLRPFTYLAGVLVGLAGSFLVIVILAASAVWYVYRFRSRSFGLIAGTAPRRRRDPLDFLAGAPKVTVDRSLVPWLGDCLSQLAGLADGEVLRFGHLWAGLGYTQARVTPRAADRERWESMSGHTDQRLVNLELITTDLTRQRPYRFPLQACDLDDPVQLWLCLDQLRTGEFQFFPDPVLAALAEGPSRTVVDRSGVERVLHPLPPPWDLPVIFAVRLSMSLPGLFQAVPLYRIVQQPPVEDDLGRRILDRGTPLPPPGSGPEVAEELWFSDGGITSNFPVHFFDSPLPRWPTVSLNLGKHPESQPMQDVWLPRDFDVVPLRAEPLSDSGLSFAGAILSTARTWRDKMQSAMPGYRNRIAQVRTRPDEGGTNLFMDREVIASMALRGALAGARLRVRFADEAQWDRFRWLRLRVALSNLEGLRRGAAQRRGFYADALSGPDWVQALAQRFPDRPVGVPVPWYCPPAEFWPAAPRLLETFAAGYTPGPGPNALTTNVPLPEPALRQVPQE